MAPMIEDMTEDDVYLDDIKQGANSNDSYIVPDFMPAARDIMNWFPSHEIFRTSLHFVEKI
jgi:hypothetical protein